jgi:hypothetical protein
MIEGFKKAVEEFIYNKGLTKRQTIEITTYFIGVLEDIERQLDAQSISEYEHNLKESTSIIERQSPDKNKAIEFAEWIRKEKYFYDNDRGKYVAAWNNYTAYPIKELYEQFLQSLK